MLSYKARRRLSVLVYVSLGVLWAFPFKYVFRGVGQADPDQD